MNVKIINSRQERTIWIATIASSLGQLTVRWVGGEPATGASADVELDCGSCELLETLPDSAGIPAIESADESGAVLVGKVEEYAEGVLAIGIGDDRLQCETDTGQWPVGQWIRFRASELTAYEV